MIFTVIENRNTWVEKINSELFPNTPKWLEYWRMQKKTCIEGKWAKDFGKWRYMPGPLYFYIHFCTLVDFDEGDSVNKRIRPQLRDIEWERGYILSCCRGFSGFEKDDKYTCHRDVKLYHKGKRSIKSLHKSCFNKAGELKEYVNAFSYIRKLHDKNLGKALFYNHALNNMELGSRGGGKSYWAALAILKYNLIFDGKKYYSRDITVSENFITASSSARSGETIKKLIASINEMYSSDEMGAYSLEGSSERMHPFYKSFSGSIGNNNGKSPFRHSYRIKDSQGGWREYEGSKLVHGIITSENPEPSAGTRNESTVVEESGLIPNIHLFYHSHRATMFRNGVRFGFIWFIGTAGNVKKIIQTSEMFNEPKEWEMLSFENTYENTGKDICFFLPAYYTNSKYKDHNGNTNVDDAIAHYMEERDRVKGNAKALLGEKMNYPIYPSEMFITDSFNAFPLLEAEARQNELRGVKKGFGADLFWKTDKEVGFIVNNKSPIPFPYRQEDDAEGTVYIYELPIKIDVEEVDSKTGEIRTVKKTPKDAYVIGLDPYATDAEKDTRNSFAAAYVMLNPKYYEYATTENIVVASYVARPRSGRGTYLDNLEKLLCFYGDPHRGLWFENDRGDHVRDFFIKKNKRHLLAIELVNMTRGRTVVYGYKIGSKIKKLDRIDKLADFLKSFDTIHNENRMMVSCISDQHLLQEIRVFDIDGKGNYDRIMALVGCVIGINNIYNEFRNELKNGKKSSRLYSFFKNNNIVNEHSNQTPLNRRTKTLSRIRSG
jgi:hypothetical protein